MTELLILLLSLMHLSATSNIGHPAGGDGRSHNGNK